MRRALLILAFMCWPTTVWAQSENATHAAIGAYVFGQITDGLTTAYGLGAGKFNEANPVLSWAQDEPVALAIVKGSLAVGVTTILLRTHKKSPKATFWTAVALAGVQIAVTVHNARLLREGRPR